MNERRIDCELDNAPKYWHWIQTRQGLAYWRSANLGNPNASWTTPAVDIDGKPYTKPTWQAESTPIIITDPAMVDVHKDEEVKRFKIAVKRGYGLSIVLTDHASKRVRTAVEQAGEGAYHRFEDGQAVIMRPVETITLLQWAQENMYPPA